MNQSRSTIVLQDIADISERLNFDSGVVEILRDVFLKVCSDFDVSEPSDPASATIARTLITVALAADGDCDARELYRRTMNRLRTLQ